MVPDESDSQNWNRYSYTLNNPLIYVDENGHAPKAFPWLTVIEVTIAVAAVVFIDTIVDPRAHATNPEASCTDTYATCFQNHERLKLENDGTNINKTQFNEMLDVVYNDLNKKWRTPIDPSRSTYDTPFWNGNPRFGKEQYHDNVVCLENKCSPRSAVNYVAQGMYSAKTGQSLKATELTTKLWNWISYYHAPTEDELYWTRYGYNAYKERKEKDDKNKK